MAKSDLERFFERERQDFAAELEPHREFARRLDVFDQAVLGGWCEFAHVARRAGVLGERGEAIREAYAADSDGYEPDHPDPERQVVAIYFGSTVNGVVEDIENGVVRIDELCVSLEQLIRLVEQHGGGHTSVYGAATFMQVVTDLLHDHGFDPEDLAPAAALTIPWQRLVWLVDCRMRRGAVLSRGRGEPLIGNDLEQLEYLLRLAANQPGLGNWPELARFVPRRAENLLPLSEQAYQRFRREGIPDDPELAERLVTEILERRHYVLDAISVIELEELGVRRIVMTPEERPDSMVKGSNPQFIAGFVIDHVAGAFAGTITIGDDSAVQVHGRRAVVMVPSILEQASAEISALEDVDNNNEDEHGMAQLHEAQAAVELLLLSAWRDLVVPDVRDQHYEIDRVRKAKGAGKRAAKRGNLEVVRYVPRRVVYRRAAREAAAREGRAEPRELYAVGAFSRRLPQGQKRSPEADAYAKEIGVPLAPHQTVVKPHFRGGTAEERQRAMEAERGLQVRHWKSWSALDLLRTRASTASPEEVANDETTEES